MQHASHSWIEIDRAALAGNVATFSQLLGNHRDLLAVVKANAYGHGLVPVAKTVLTAGADGLVVFDVKEAFALRDAQVSSPILVLGPVAAAAFGRLARERIHFTVGGRAAVEQVSKASEGPLHVHLKLECGTQRQGLAAEELAPVAKMAALPHVVVSGAYTHFADIEDTTDHRFAMEQLTSFRQRIAQLQELGVRAEKLHTACTAATLLFEETYFDGVRVGIGLYGLWPSKETLVSVRQSGKEPVTLRPVMTWKTRVSQVKSVAANVTVGYGRTFKTTRPSRLAVLPIGYANGYARNLAGRGHVLVRGQRAKICGRVMMNMTVVDVTDITSTNGAAVDDEVVLLGEQGGERVSAEMLASWLDTINYEVVTCADPLAPRLLR